MLFFYIKRIRFITKQSDPLSWESEEVLKILSSGREQFTYALDVKHDTNVDDFISKLFLSVFTVFGPLSFLFLDYEIQINMHLSNT